MVLSDWNTRWKIAHALGNLVPNHLEAFKLERQPAFGVLLQQINLTVTSPLLYRNAPTIALQKSPCLCLIRLLRGSHILPERLWQTALHPHCPRQRKCISSQTGHTIETRPEFQTWADWKALIFCVSRSLETGLSTVVWVDALLNTGLSHGTAIKTLLLATYFLVWGQLKTALSDYPRNQKGPYCSVQEKSCCLLHSPLWPPPRCLAGGILLY